MSLSPGNTVQPTRLVHKKETIRMPTPMFRVLDALASIVIVVLAVGTGAATAFLSA